MLFKEIFAIYCENHTVNENRLCEQNEEYFNVKTGGTYKCYIFKGIRLKQTLSYRNSTNISAC
jgi:hypothetical protein